MGKSDLEKLETGELLNLTEDNLSKFLDELLLYRNIPRYGDATEAILDELADYMKKQELDNNIQWELDDRTCDAASSAGTYGYVKGFKDGIILFRTLMKL